MGKLFVPPRSRTQADYAREALDQAERCMANLRGTGTRSLELLHLLDQAVQVLAELEASVSVDTGVDVRAEHARFEALQRQLRRRQGRFLAEVSPAVLREERAAVQPDRVRWWWFLDEAVARQRLRQLRRGLIGTLAVALVLAVAWLGYDRFIAPPRQVRQAFRHSASGESLVEDGDLRAALAEFEAAAALNPDDSDPWLWQGVIRFELGDLDGAEVAFDTARSLYETDFDFLLGRGMAYLRVGNLAAASADAEQAIVENSRSGWGYYLRASIAVERGDYGAAVADLERAAGLAYVSQDVQLEAYARTQRAMVVQLQLRQQSTPQPP